MVLAAQKPDNIANVIIATDKLVVEERTELSKCDADPSIDQYMSLGDVCE